MLSQNQIDIIIDSMMPYDPVRIGIFGSESGNYRPFQSKRD
jgi:hypothetical protein